MPACAERVGARQAGDAAADDEDGHGGLRSARDAGHGGRRNRRHERAERVRLERVARPGERPGPRAAADLARTRSGRSGP